MSEEPVAGTLRQVLALLARHLEDFLEGDELALERLGSALEQGNFSGEDLQAAVLTLRSLTCEPAGAPLVAAQDAPGRFAHRVLSQQERASLSPEAWGFLLDLRKRGSLDSAQFERVLDRLAASDVRPVDVETAHRVAVRVALSAAGEGFESATGESDVAH